MVWQINVERTEVNFSLQKAQAPKVRGKINPRGGLIDFNPDKPSEGSFELIMDANSIYTQDRTRDVRIKSADILDVANFPTITFRSRETRLRTPNSGSLHGDLTIRGITRPVIFRIGYSGTVRKTPWGRSSAALQGMAKISRSEFGLLSPQTGRSHTDQNIDEITIMLEMELIQQPIWHTV